MAASDRREAPRLSPAPAGYENRGIVRPGHDVHVLNLAQGGALVACGSRLRPGMSTELQMFRGEARVLLRVSVSRCRVSHLAPLVYEAALCFEAPLDVSGGPPHDG